MTTTAPSTDIGNRLRRLADWADRCPRQHRLQVMVSVERLALLLADCVADDEEDEP